MIRVCAVFTTSFTRAVELRKVLVLKSDNR